MIFDFHRIMNTLKGICHVVIIMTALVSCSRHADVEISTPETLVHFTLSGDKEFHDDQADILVTADVPVPTDIHVVLSLHETSTISSSCVSLPDLIIESGQIDASGVVRIDPSELEHNTVFRIVVEAAIDGVTLDAAVEWNYTTSPEPEVLPEVEIEVNYPSDELGFSTYYSPSGNRAGDPMPFYDPLTCDFKVLYLYETDHNDPYCYHPFWGISTTDCANYTSLAQILPTGRTRYDLDAALGTGCAVYDDFENKYYIYYTGHGDREVVLRAVSSDFKVWEKDTDWVLKGEDYGYSVRDFRDPHVFRDDNGHWHMIVSSYGMFAEFTSENLKEWSYEGDFGAMYSGHMLECPDVFKMGDWWYIIFSDSYRSAYTRNVRYMKARSLDELRDCLDRDHPIWPDDKEGVLDSRAFYAGKTASDGVGRYIWGWCPFRSGASIPEKNANVGADSEPNWSGALVCHRLIQYDDGTLSLGKVKGINDKYSHSAAAKCLVSVNATSSTGSLILNGPGSYAIYGRLGFHNHISMSVTTSSDTDQFGISFMRGTKQDEFYSMVVCKDGAGRRIKFAVESPMDMTIIRGVDSYIFRTPTDNKYDIDIYTDNSVITMYINDVCAYTQRIYGIQTNCWSINGYSGEIKVNNIRISRY